MQPAKTPADFGGDEKAWGRWWWGVLKTLNLPPEELEGWKKSLGIKESAPRSAKRYRLVP